MRPVKVMDRTHPLFGKTLALLSERCGRGKSFIAVALQDDRRRLVPRSATDLDSSKKQGVFSSKATMCTYCADASAFGPRRSTAWRTIPRSGRTAAIQFRALQKPLAV